MSEAQKHQQEVELRKQYQLQMKQDKAIGEDLANQNDRLRRLIDNYRLNRTWGRIMFRMRMVEKIKKLNPFKKKTV